MNPWPCNSWTFTPRKILSRYLVQWLGGQTEYRLPDKTRCDCLTDTNAVEVDFARKFYEALGQSLYYSMQTDKRAGRLLIIESDNCCASAAIG